MGDTFVAEAGQRLGMANVYIGEASQRIAEVSAWGVQAAQYTITSQEYLNIAGRYLASGQAKINEFYTLMGRTPEIQHTRATALQPTAY